MHSGSSHAVAPGIDPGALQHLAGLSPMDCAYVGMPAVYYNDGSLASWPASVDYRRKQKWRDGPAAYETVTDGGALVFVVDENDHNQTQQY